jgi:hypothetical protein
MQRVQYHKDVDKGKATGKKSINKVSLIVAAVMLLSISFSQLFYSYMQIGYAQKINPENRTAQMENNFEIIKKEQSLNSEFNPDFKIGVNNFDLIINTSIGGESDDVLSAGIWKYNPGKYALTATVEGMAVLEAIEWQLNDVLDKNKRNNIIIEVEAIGSSDALPDMGQVYYDGLLGDSISVTYYRFNDPEIALNETFIKGKTLMTNEYLALLRALDAVKYLCGKYDIDPKNTKIIAREFDREGPEYRRLDLQITLRDAFLKDYEEMNRNGRRFWNFLKRDKQVGSKQISNKQQAASNKQASHEEKEIKNKDERANARKGQATSRNLYIRSFYV